MYVYVISAGEDRQKVGMAANPIDRLNSLRTGSPTKLTLAHIEEVEDARVIERRAHEMMASCRVHGEWFNCSVAAAISMVKGAVYEFANPDPVYSTSESWPMKVGDKVVCRKGGEQWVLGSHPIEGEAYTIAVMHEAGGLYLEEVPNEHVAFCPSMFWPAGQEPAAAATRPTATAGK